MYTSTYLPYWLAVVVLFIKRRSKQIRLSATGYCHCTGFRWSKNAPDHFIPYTNIASLSVIFFCLFVSDNFFSLYNKKPDMPEDVKE